MIIIHVHGGLGNQMAAYAEYVAVMESNPGEKIYFDTYIYDIKEAHSTMAQWNGYELEKDFGIDIPDVRTLFTNEEVQEQLEYLRQSKFWENDWNYDETFICMMRNYGLNLKWAFTKDFTTKKENIKSTIIISIKKYMEKAARKNRIVYMFKSSVYKVLIELSKDCGKGLCQKREGDYYYGLSFEFLKSRFLHDTIGEQVRNDLTFKEPEDEVNLKYLNLIRNCNSVSVHVRNTDFLQYVVECYKYGYFKKAIQYIRKNVENPVFFLFSDDMNWCRSNLKSIGLNEKDTIYYVDINKGENSYRDMQLMSNCKHNIATRSTFGWWASFLNDNPKKITCCQICENISTNQF